MRDFSFRVHRLVFWVGAHRRGGNWEPSHGPRSWPWWRLASPSICRLGVQPPSGGWRLWVYTRWVDVFIDAYVDRRASVAPVTRFLAVFMTLALFGCIGPNGNIDPPSPDGAIEIGCRTGVINPKICADAGYPTPRPTATVTPTAGPTSLPTTTSPTSTPAPSSTPATPTPTATPAPTATATPADVAGCLNVDAIPLSPVPVFTGGACRGAFVTVGAPRFGNANDPSEITGWDAGCVRDWPCADGDQRYRPARRIGDSLAGGGLGGVHRCLPGEGMGPQFICDAGRAGQDAYGRNIRDDGTIIYPPAGVDDGEPWRRASICAPVRCSATPAPTVAPTAGPTPAPSGSCALPPGEGNGVDCPRTAPRHLAAVDAAITRVVAAHPEWFEPGREVVVEPHGNDFRFAVVDELRRASFCAFFDGEEIALKNTNDFSEQYHVLSSANHVRRGDGSYRATCTPAWSEIPSSTPVTALRPPLLVDWIPGNACHNPKEGPKYQNGLCVVGSTPWFGDPDKPNSNDGHSPCDPEHPVGWNAYCHGIRWGDARGPLWTFEGAEYIGPEDGNPYHAVFRFNGPFKACARPRPDVNHNGVPIPVRGTAEVCRTVNP